jgi:hypothetical protein
MCTLVALFAPQAPHPLVVAANRDERLNRRATPPRLWTGSPRFVAPRDEEAGGTWLGLNARGLFVGITNRYGVVPEPNRLSRGALVVDALSSPDAASLHERLGPLPPRQYNAFHLLYADRSRMFVTWSDGERLHREELRPGLHVITERSLGGDDHARTELILARAEPLLSAEPPRGDALAALMGQHRAGDRAGSVCVHDEAFGYGTRSSLLLWLGRSWADTRLSWAEGPPCTAPFVDQAPLVAALRDAPPL